MNNTEESVPLSPELLNLANQGNLFLGQGKFDDAVDAYRKVLALKSDFAEVHNNLGVALQQQGKLDAAAQCYQRALLINPTYPDAYQNIGRVFKDQGKPEVAVQCYQQALLLRPNYADTYCNLGIAFKALGNLDAAIENYQKALSINPNLAEARFNLGFSLLCLGRFAEGWLYHETRYDAQIKKQNSISFPKVSFPQWQGECIYGKSLLIWPEQGLGDEIQFCRYVEVLKSQGAKYITWVCKKSLQALFMSLKGVDRVITEKEADFVQAHDYWTLALSLPLHCKTTLDNIPATVPYLYANPKLIKNIATLLKPNADFKIGVCWRGNAKHKNDKNRSPGIESFSPLFKLAGVSFFTLQPGTRDEFLAATGDVGFDLGREIDESSFEEAATLIMNLDLVIACDTSIAHLAGALGKPVWIVLPFDPDWRWLINREDSPWYPTARLFRQTKAGDWSEVFERLEKQLKAVLMGENSDSLSLSDAFQTAMQYHQMGNFAQAEALYRQILQQDPTHPDALHFLGVLAYQVGQNEAAVELIGKAINVYPTSSPMYCNRGLALQALGKLDAAVESYQRALELQSDYADAYYNLGNTLQEQGKLDSAIENYRKSLSLNPGFAAAHNNLGNVFKQQNNLESAIASYLAAIAAKPDYAQAHHNLGIAQQEQGKYNAAFENYQKALAIAPDYPDAHSALGVLLLCLGQFKEGWLHYEARYDTRLKNKQTAAPNFQFPQWQGEPIAGKSLLIWSEQGFGDEIQFCRYASVLKSQGVKKITWVCKKPLKSLIETLKSIDNVFTTDELALIQAHDYWTFALSIPLHCQTTLETIPATVPYLSANSDLIAAIAAELGSIHEFKVGVCWKGNPGHKNDINRSPGIVAFKPLFDLPGVKFFNLQPDTREEFIQSAGKNAVDRGHEIDKSSFEEAAALIMNLDLVITCDTSICHLAGALGKPVWIVLPQFTTDWRWLLEREDSPWYPTACLFRQKSQGDWGEVFQRVEKQLHLEREKSKHA